MSSVVGEGQEGGSNEDVEADVLVRNAEARLDEHEDVERESEGSEAEEDQADIEYGDFESPKPAEEVLAEEEGMMTDQDNLGHDQYGEVVEDQDFAQFGREVDESVGDVSSDAGPSTPVRNRSPPPSPLDSGSIPDDTPSWRGSFISSSGRGASPLPRRSASRMPSGALQPFERRFETRLSASAASPRAQSPAFLSPHSRQVSISSQLSGLSSDAGDSATDPPQAPWDVIRWTKLRKLTGQAFSESGRRSFGRPTCMAVSAMIVIGTSKGLVLGFDYHQTLKIIIGPGTKATECGSVNALAIAADYSTIASGHANGTIFTWEISRPAKPFLVVLPMDRSMLQEASHPDGHLANTAILHVGFLGTRHTALVSADAGGMAFSHLATRGLGPVTRTIKSTRLLGRYPPADSQAERNRKPSSVLAFSPLPLGNVEQATDGMGLTALLTPYLLVIVSTTPIAQTQHKSSRPKEITPHSTLSGCLAWFPAVKLKSSSAEAYKGNSDTKLVYCWSNVLTVLDVKVVLGPAADPRKPPSLEFKARSRWRAEEAIVGVQWLGKSVLGVLTISQRLLIVEDGSLKVTDSIDLLHRHIYHQDLFSSQLHTVVESLDSEDAPLHGVIADAFHMSYKVYKGRIFLLGHNDLSVGTLSNWADRLIALMEAGDHIAAIRLAIDYYAGSANNVTIGLPDADDARHAIVRERIIAIISASLSYTFAQEDEQSDQSVRDLAGVCFEACTIMKELDYLFNHVFETFQASEKEPAFVATLEQYVLDGEIHTLPPDVVKAVVAYFVEENQASQLEEVLCRLQPHSFDLHQITTLCRQHSLYDALIYVWTQALRDYVTPLIDLLQLVKMLLDTRGADEDLSDNPFYESAAKVFPFLAYALTSRKYPGGALIDDDEADQAKTDLYDYVFAGTPMAWPPGSQKIFRTADKSDDEPAFPYLDLLLRFDAASFMSMLNEAFEDSFLNETEDENDVNGASLAKGLAGKKKSRQQIIEIMLDVMRQGDFEPEQVIYLDMFVARSLPKYSGQLILTGTLLNSVLQRLCRPPLEILWDDCQLSVEYLLSAHHPSNTAGLIEALKAAKFFRVLKSLYRGEGMFTELLQLFFEDPNDKQDIFDCISFCLRPSTKLSLKQTEAIKRVIQEHTQDLADIDTVATSRTLATSCPDQLHPGVQNISDPHQQFIFLRALLEPSLLRDGRLTTSPLSSEQQSVFHEQYVQLMCRHDPTHVADYIRLLPSSDLRLEKVLPAMEESGVIDAAVVILARDGLARDAMDRIVAHMLSLQRALAGLVDAAISNPDATASRQTSDELVEDVQKYSRVGLWLCRGATAAAQRKPRPRRTNMVWDLDEDELDLDEYLWLNLVDVVVQVSQSVGAVVARHQRHPSAHDENALDSEKLATSLRSAVQHTFTSLLASTATPTIQATQEQQQQQQQQQQTPQQTPQPRHDEADRTSFLRILRAFLCRASKTSPSLSDLRAVLQDIFSAYTFEESVLGIATALLQAATFTDVHQAHTLRQRGWRPRSQICEHCKRRAWGTALGETVWSEWVHTEQEREAERVRKNLERSGGAEARRRSKGKMSVSCTPAAWGGRGRDVEGRDVRKLALVVFACRHVYHRLCIDESHEGRRSGGMYRCPGCAGKEGQGEGERRV